jgi:serine/threonine protein kinase
MPLAPGTCLGPYEVQSAIGSGGMGDLYRARDTHLDRAVAIKVLSARVASEHVLRFAIQIADALDRAHRHGIVHRDLKPGNIFLVSSRPSSGSDAHRRTDVTANVKVLDFGLAKPNAAEPAEGVSMLPTEHASVTAEGTILGTLQYMAPEQLEGRKADARTDLFAFGAVVYEMATGRKAFEGRSQASVISAILRDDPPPMATLQPLVPEDHADHGGGI